MPQSYYNPMTGETIEELYHHGILGQKWGVRRYQNKDGSLKPAGRKKLGIVGNIKANMKKKNIQKKRQKTLEAKKKAAEEQAKKEEFKKKALERGTANDLLKLRGDISSDEYMDVIKRLENEERIRRFAADENAKKVTKLDRLVSGTEKAGKVAENVLDVAKKITEFSDQLDEKDKKEKEKARDEKQNKNIQKLITEASGLTQDPYVQAQLRLIASTNKSSFNDARNYVNLIDTVMKETANRPDIYYNHTSNDKSSNNKEQKKKPVNTK